MSPTRRIGWTLVVALVSALTTTSPATAQSPSPDLVGTAPFDLEATMPTHIGTVELAVEAYGAEEMARRLQVSEDVLMSTLRTVLAGPGGTAATVSMATARPAEPGGPERYRIVAMRADGIDATALISGMFRVLMAEQMRADGVEDSDEIQRMTEGFESLLPWQTIVGREVVSPNAASDTRFELFYPLGEVLFIVQAADGASMEDVLAALP